MALKDIGALWIGRGKAAYSGQIEPDGRGGKKLKILVFKNENKKSDKHPDFRIVEQTTDEKPAQTDEEPF
jgi:uncharacterized protein (DUF736 family)